MKLLVVSNAPFIFSGNEILAYAPYVKEMEMWNKYAGDISFCCPVWNKTNGLLVSEIPFKISRHYRVADFNLTSFSNILKAIPASFFAFLIILKAMRAADHIHLRCPGNIGLLACVAQIFFSGKSKTVKYAGNWDPKAPQPITYKLQRWILSNTFLTRNTKVLVYGRWPKMSKNIYPFFTATYRDLEKQALIPLDFKNEIHFVFAGTLVSGKNPEYAVNLVMHLHRRNFNVNLKIFGNGAENERLHVLIKRNNLEAIIQIVGNQPAEVLKNAYKNSHFMILPSDSEGWPKVVAEAMFWGCVPLTTPVSCVPFMLDYGKRGVLLEKNIEDDLAAIESLIASEADFNLMRSRCSEWSREFTLETFESEIRKLLNV